MKAANEYVCKYGHHVKSNLLIGVVLILLVILTGCVDVNTEITIYEDEGWQATQTLILPRDAVILLENEDPSVAELARQIDRAMQNGEREDIDYVFTQSTLVDESMRMVATGSGKGFDLLDELFLDGKADFETEEINGEEQVFLFRSNIDSAALAAAGGSNRVSVTGDEIILSTADQTRGGAEAVWINPAAVDVRVIPLEGGPALIDEVPVVPIEEEVPPTEEDEFAPPAEEEAVPTEEDEFAPPAEEEAVPTEEDEFAPPIEAETAPADEDSFTPPLGGAAPSFEPVDVISNGNFEKPFVSYFGVATDWGSYNNGGAEYGWYNEEWREAVRNRDGQAQLMEIDRTGEDAVDRVIAIQQTVNVAPNADYELTIHAIMRTNGNKDQRNNDDYEMQWGFDPTGQGEYDNVPRWVKMPLTEQLRIGSNGPLGDNQPLFYERITGTVRMGPNTNRVTLFIRGVKKFETEVEVNFNVDDVSLIGPPPNISIPVTQAAAQPSPPEPAAPAVAEPESIPDPVPEATNQEQVVQATPLPEPAAPAVAEPELMPDPVPEANDRAETVQTAPPAAPAQDRNRSALPSSGASLAPEVSVGAFALGGLVLVAIGLTATVSLLQDWRGRH